MKKTYLQSGFTLIELLVVIAIIGILSSIVLASLSTARTKGRNASAQGSLSSVRAQAEIFASNNASANYGTAAVGSQASPALVYPVAGSNACNQAQTIALLASVFSNTGNTANCNVGVSGGSWIAYSTLADQTTPANYCVDSSGFSGVKTAAPAAIAVTGIVSCN